MNKLKLGILALTVGGIIGGGTIPFHAFSSFDNPAVPPLADTTDKDTFQFRIEKDNSKYILHAEHGTSWKRLSFECKEAESNCVVTLSRNGLANGNTLNENNCRLKLEKFAFTIREDPQNSNRLILQKGMGTDWKKLTFTFGPLAKSWTVNQSGAQPDFNLPKGVKALVTYRGSEVQQQETISDQWETAAKVNGRVIREGDTVHIQHDQIELEATVRERDFNENYGQGVTTLDLSRLKKRDRNKHPQTKTIRMEEKKGAHKGATADWRFRFIIFHD